MNVRLAIKHSVTFLSSLNTREHILGKTLSVLNVERPLVVPQTSLDIQRIHIGKKQYVCRKCVGRPLAVALNSFVTRLHTLERNLMNALSVGGILLRSSHLTRHQSVHTLQNPL